MNSHQCQQILNETNGGLDLICECYPKIRNVQLGKFFAIREENHPSAHIIQRDGVYLLKDFGGSYAKARNGIQVYADYHNISVEQAVNVLASRYCPERENRINGPQVYANIASGDNYKEGQRRFVFKDTPTQSELAFLAPMATVETLEQLNWKSVKQLVLYKRGKEITISSTPTFPIFAREMHDAETGNLLGYKIYQPRSENKSYKFFYYPSGMLSGTYWHGLYELKQAVDELKQKVDAVIICSGERDALVVKSMGAYPVWGNSETALINDTIYGELNKLAKNIYLIPDIDETGRAMGIQNMRNYPELYVVWLPEKMKKRTSDQQKACKDLRDWAQTHRTKKDFYALLTQARPYQFWSFDHEKGRGEVNQDYLLHFLGINGFAKIKNPLTKDYEFIRVTDHIVSSVTTKDMRNFVMQSIDEQPARIRNIVLKSKCAELKQLEDLPVREFDMTDSTAYSQIFFFGKKQYMVTADGIAEVDESSKVFVREEKVSQHEVTLLPPLFTWKKTDKTDDGGAPIYIIEDTGAGNSKLQHFLRCSSMLHWRNDDSFSISTEEEMEENRVLTVKMFHIGYMLHRKRMKSNDWAPIMMDYNTPVDAEGANGGVGKSFLYQDVFPAAGYNVVKVRKQSKRPAEADFLFDQVTADTDIVYFDECAKDFHFEDLNDVITGDMVVNKKNKSMFTIPYKDVPKMAFLTNYVPKDFDASSDRRHIYDVSSDYFHQRTATNGYQETRTIMSEFGCALLQDDYSDKDWNLDMNFLMQVEQFYLDVRRTTKLKLTPPMANIMKRHDKGSIDDEFNMWADAYFCDVTHLNRPISLSVMLNEYNTAHAFSKMDKKKMKKNIRLWADINGLEYNPLEQCNDKATRRIKFRNGSVIDEMIYLRGTYDP